MTTPGVIQRRGYEWLFASECAVAVAFALLATSDLKLVYRLALLVGLVGLAALATLPNRRILLVGAWVFLHPLSLEKVAQFAANLHPQFLPPTLVVSGSDLALFCLAMLQLAESLVKRESVFCWPAAATPFALLCGWVICEFFLLMPSPTGVLQVTHWLKLFVAMIVLSSAIRTREDLLFVLAMVALSVGLQSAFVGYTYLTHKRLGASEAVTHDALLAFSNGGSESFVRATGTLGHSNQQAMFHVFMTLPIIGLCWLRNVAWRGVFMVVLVASVAASVLTFSRSSWLAWGLGGAVILLMAQRRGLMTRQVLGYLSVGALASVLLVIPFTEPIINRLTKGDDGASAARVRMAHMALDYIQRFPVTGVGPGNFIDAKLKEVRIDRLPNTWLPRNTSFVTPVVAKMEMYQAPIAGHLYYFPGVVHNKFLQVCSELGGVGLALFLWYQWRVLQHCLRASRAASPVGSWTGIGLTAMFWATMLFFNLDLFYDDKTVLVPVFANILAMAAARITAQENLARENLTQA